MKSAVHAVVSLVVAGLALAVTTPPVPAWAVVAVALVAGVGIDFDHFLLARWRCGDWRAVGRCLRDPRILFVDQDAVFEYGEVGAITRLLSHVLVGGVAVPLLWLASPSVAGVVAVSLYAHVLADLVATDRHMVAVPVSDGAETEHEAVAADVSETDEEATMAE